MPPLPRGSLPVLSSLLSDNKTVLTILSCANVALRPLRNLVKIDTDTDEWPVALSHVDPATLRWLEVWVCQPWKALTHLAETLPHLTGLSLEFSHNRRNGSTTDYLVSTRPPSSF